VVSGSIWNWIPCPLFCSWMLSRARKLHVE
jgi:hypothetical protein